MSQKVTVKLPSRRSGTAAGEPVEQEVQATLVSSNKETGVAVVQVGATRFPVPLSAIQSVEPVQAPSKAPLPAASPLERFKADSQLSASFRTMVEAEGKAEAPASSD